MPRQATARTAARPALRVEIANEPALRAALAAGLRLWGLATGNTVTSAMQDELVQHQLSAMRRTLVLPQLPPPPAKLAPPPRPEPEPKPQGRLWWKEDE